MEKSIKSKWELIFWNVGQGDFASLTGPHTCWVFDPGGSLRIPPILVQTLRTSCPGRKITLSVSHFDKDHIKNYGSLLKNFSITDVYVSHRDPRSKFGQKFLILMAAKKINIHVVGSGFRPSGPLSFLCLWPINNGELGHLENNFSLVWHLKINSTSILITGDLPTKMERYPTWPQVEILKVAHHGSRTSTSSDFLNELKPKECVVSVGKNSYGHPSIETLKRLKMARCAILRTDKLGPIKFEL